jgi:hypothetical protein
VKQWQDRAAPIIWQEKGFLPHGPGKPIPGYLEIFSGGQGFSQSITRVDTKKVPVVNFSYQGLLVQTYI